MFVQIFRNETIFVVVNINQIVYLEPVKSGGCRVVLSNNTDFFASDDHETILENIRIAQQ